MSNEYRVLLPLQVNGHTQGETFEHDFTADDEADVLSSGLLEIVPREYLVIGDSDVFETKTGETFTRALRVGEEAALVAGGHIERVEKPAPAPGRAKTKKKEEGS